MLTEKNIYQPSIPIQVYCCYKQLRTNIDLLFAVYGYFSSSLEFRSKEMA